MYIAVEYTYSERLAQAKALGITYRQLMLALQYGEELPCQKEPIVWPAGSPHSCEKIVYRGIVPAPKPAKEAPPPAEPAPDPEPEEPPILDNPQLETLCSCCGKPIVKRECTVIGIRRPGGKTYKVAAYLCAACEEKMVQAMPYLPKQKEKPRD